MRPSLPPLSSGGPCAPKKAIDHFTCVVCLNAIMSLQPVKFYVFEKGINQFISSVPEQLSPS